MTNEFTVAVPPEQAWQTLLDIERVAGFLPGAKIEPSSEQDVYRGSMRVKVGPMIVNYEGTARLVLADESEHIADIVVEAKDTKGQGTAAATIRNRVIPHNGGTRVVAETDLAITGRQAQFGRGIMQDVAGRMLEEFARRFEDYLLQGDSAGSAGGETTGATTTDAGALDVGAVVFRTPAVQRGLAALGGLVLAFLLFGRRRSSSR